MADKHLSTQFDSELSSLSSRVMELGGLVEGDLGTGARGTAAEIQALDFTGMREIPGQRRQQRRAKQELLYGGPFPSHGGKSITPRRGLQAPFSL